MPKPRVFVSSTYYDLKYVRADLSRFISELGYEPILSEKGDIAYDPNRPLDDSCYRAIGSSDVFVVVVGGRYGSPSSDQKDIVEYDSVTRRELQAAVAQQVPTYILIDKAVYAEYRTYLRNKDKHDIQYVHVDNVQIYRTIEWIEALKKNNPIHAFEHAEDIVLWLRDQWAGLFRELMNRRSTDQKLTDLANQVDSLRDLNVTLKRYLEELVKKDLPPISNDAHGATTGTKIIEDEDKRLLKAGKRRHLRQNHFVQYTMRLIGSYRLRQEEGGNVPEEGDDELLDKALEILTSAKSQPDLVQKLESAAKSNKSPTPMTSPHTVMENPAAIIDLNTARRLLGQPDLPAGGL